MFLAKIVLVGDKNVGKTTFQTKYLGRPVDSKYHRIINVKFSLKKEITNGKQMNYQIWRLVAARPVYYLGSLGGILMFDVTNRTSF